MRTFTKLSMIVKLAVLMFSALYRVLDAKNNTDCFKVACKAKVKLTFGNLTKTVM